MIIDLRYHIASLVAVFLALGVGIFIGSTILGNDTIVRQQEQLTKRLESQLEELRQKTVATEARASKLENNNSIQEQFEKQLLPMLIQDKLSGVQVAIVVTSDYGLPEDLKSVLEMAGAKVDSVTTILNNFNDKERKEKLKQNLDLPELSGEQLEEKLITEIAKGIATGGNQILINTLVEEGFLEVSGNYGTPLNAVVFLGGSQNSSMVRVKEIDLPMIDYFISKRIKVFGVEESEIVYSYMKEYQKKRIGTVDNIDTIPGQVALVESMSGKPGHYGIKPTAQKLLPSFSLSKRS